MKPATEAWLIKAEEDLTAIRVLRLSNLPTTCTRRSSLC